MSFLTNSYRYVEAEVLLTEYTGGSDNGTVANNVIPRRAELVQNVSSYFLGLNISKISFNIKKQGSPTGLLYVRVRNDADTIRLDFGSLDIATLTTSYEWHDFQAASNVTLEVGDRVSIEFDGGAWASVNLFVQMNSGADAYDPPNTSASYYNGSSWVLQQDQDLNFKLYA